MDEDGTPGLTTVAEVLERALEIRGTTLKQRRLVSAGWVDAWVLGAGVAGRVGAGGVVAGGSSGGLRGGLACEGWTWQLCCKAWDDLFVLWAAVGTVPGRSACLGGPTDCRLVRNARANPHITHPPLCIQTQVQEVCQLVCLRSARLCAAAIAGVLHKAGHPSGGSGSTGSNGSAPPPVVVAVDGSVFAKYRSYRWGCCAVLCRAALLLWV